MKKIALSLITLSIFAGNVYSSDSLNSDCEGGDDILNNIDFNLQPEAIPSNNSPILTSHIKRDLENKGGNSDLRMVSPPKKSKSPQSSESTYTGKYFSEPVFQSDIIASEHDFISDDESLENASSLIMGLAVLPRQSLLDGSIIMNAKRISRPKADINIDKDEKPWIMFKEREAAKAQDPGERTWCFTNDLTILIFRLLDVASAKQACLVCAHFANLFNKRQSLKFAKGVSENQLVSVLKTKAYFLRHLDLSNCIDIRSKTFEDFIPYLEQLESFVVYPKIYSPVLGKLGENRKTLKSIKFNLPNIEKTFSEFLSKFSSDDFSNLESMILGNSELIYDGNIERKMLKNSFLKFCEKRKFKLEVVMPISRPKLEWFKANLSDKITNNLIEINLVVME